MLEEWEEKMSYLKKSSLKTSKSQVLKTQMTTTIQPIKMELLPLHNLHEVSSVSPRTSKKQVNSP